MPRVITKLTAEAPFVVVMSMGYGLRGEPAHVAVVETDGKTEPSMISFRGRGVRDIVWGSGNVYCGKTERSASSRAIARAIQIAGQHNHVYRASLGLVTITVAEIDAAENETYRRNLIEVYRDGLVGYLRDSGAQTVQRDDIGELFRRETVGDPVVAVLVKCPSTGRAYARLLTSAERRASKAASDGNAARVPTTTTSSPINI
jgi:hypothetical protein